MTTHLTLGRVAVDHSTVAYVMYDNDVIIGFLFVDNSGNLASVSGLALGQALHMMQACTPIIVLARF